MVKNPSALEPEITNMVPSIWQSMDEWRQWSLFTGQGRCAATMLPFHPTGAAPGQHMEKIWRQSSQMPIRRPFCPLPKTWKLLKLILITKKNFYSLPGYHHNSTELVFRNLVNPLSVSSNQEMQIWYGQDWMDRGEEDNSGKTCVDVYAWYEWVCPLEILPSIALKRRRKTLDYKRTPFMYEIPGNTFRKTNLFQCLRTAMSSFYTRQKRERP